MLQTSVFGFVSSVGRTNVIARITYSIHSRVKKMFKSINFEESIVAKFEDFILVTIIIKIIFLHRLLTCI